eukprot:CAMPEP_0184874646 /NCGR_PEP_ID=MMETSP0580-20130426/42518_1 /TAXON_ID=1118495 /ORGANISM="Dactyliosolen fragilissimus" /LENGTH=63 /DNA_ID=CAMNT_0027377697 /DNA_START=117 /DNA_END=308 /DNA_ORIENTATION=+
MQEEASTTSRKTTEAGQKVVQQAAARKASLEATNAQISINVAQNEDNDDANSQDTRSMIGTGE